MGPLFLVPTSKKQPEGHNRQDQKWPGLKSTKLIDGKLHELIRSDRTEYWPSPEHGRPAEGKVRECPTALQLRAISSLSRGGCFWLLAYCWPHPVIAVGVLAGVEATFTGALALGHLCSKSARDRCPGRREPDEHVLGTLQADGDSSESQTAHNSTRTRRQNPTQRQPPSGLVGTVHFQQAFLFGMPVMVANPCGSGFAYIDCSLLLGLRPTKRTLLRRSLASKGQR